MVDQEHLRYPEMLLVGQALDCELQWEAWQNGAIRKYFEGSVRRVKRVKQMRREPFKTDLSAPLMTDYSLSFSRELEWTGLPSSPHSSHSAGDVAEGMSCGPHPPPALLHFSTRGQSRLCLDSSAVNFHYRNSH